MDMVREGVVQVIPRKSGAFTLKLGRLCPSDIATAGDAILAVRIDLVTAGL